MSEEVVDQLKTLREKCTEEHCQKYQVRQVEEFMLVIAHTHRSGKTGSM
jgi:hypothetical protein